jgi:hypothetical protein
MSDLRKEYNEHKREKADMIDEASTQWVDQNIILISERISRRTVKSLTDKIVKFDKEFGPFKAQLPAVADQIAQAENGLQKIVTGHSNDDKAMKLLKQLGYLYNAYSEYFNRDLPVILATPLLRGAQGNPEVKLSVLQAPGHDPSVIRSAFKHSLEPSKEENKLLKKIYRGTQPLINASDISAQMLNLSFNELLQLTQTEKVPMIDFPPEAEEEAPAEPPQQQPEAPINESAQVLGEEWNQEKLATMNASVAKISASLAEVPGLEGLHKIVDGLEAKASEDMNKNAIGGAAQKVNPFTSSAVKQLALFSELIGKMSEIWPTAKGFLSKKLASNQPLDQQEIGRLVKNLTSGTSDGWTGALTRAVGTQHAPGLDPKSVAQQIGQAAMQSQASGMTAFEAIDQIFVVGGSVPTAADLMPQEEEEQQPAADPAAAEKKQAVPPPPPPTAQATPPPVPPEATAAAAQPLPGAPQSDTVKVGTPPTPAVPIEKLQQVLNTLQSSGFTPPAGSDPNATAQALLKAVNAAGLNLNAGGALEEVKKK